MNNLTHLLLKPWPNALDFSPVAARPMGLVGLSPTNDSQKDTNLKSEFIFLFLVDQNNVP